MVIGALPYVLRNLLEIFLKSRRVRLFGGILFAMCGGLFLCAAMWSPK
jgi:hypothetical protein